MIAGTEQLPASYESQGQSVRIPVAETGSGSAVEAVVTVEQEWDGKGTQSIPRVVPLGTEILHEEWNITVVRPLEVIGLDSPGFLQTSLTDDSRRETLTFLGLSEDSKMTLTVRERGSPWVATCVTRRRNTSPRPESETMIEVAAIQSPRFAIDVELARPWSIVSAQQIDVAGTASTLSYEQVHGTTTGTRLKIHLRTPASRGRPAIVSLLTAARSLDGFQEPLQGIIQPEATTVEHYVEGNPIRHGTQRLRHAAGI